MERYQAESIGRIIAERRREKGLTQEGLANLLQITPQAISKWENGVGLPDLILVPRIAQTLGMTMNELFGAGRGGTYDLPLSYKGMSFVCTDGSAAVYSTKSVESCDETRAVFSDGSVADLRGWVVTNMGVGDIRIYDVGDMIPESGTENGDETFEKQFEGISSLELVNSAACDFTVAVGEDACTRVVAEGSKRFISHLAVTQNGDRLTVDAKALNNHSGNQSGNRVKIFCGFARGDLLSVTINGCGRAGIELPFGTAELTIGGSGGIELQDADACGVTISGSGYIRMGNAKERLSVCINGSGDVSCADAKNAEVAIAGSGELHTGMLFGTCKVAVSGSGDVFCTGGEVEHCAVAVSGSGGLNAGNLTVGDAEITLQGSGGVELGRIKGKSVERLSKNATLTVHRRG